MTSRLYKMDSPSSMKQPLLKPHCPAWPTRIGAASHDLPHQPSQHLRDSSIPHIMENYRNIIVFGSAKSGKTKLLEKLSANNTCQEVQTSRWTKCVELDWPELHSSSADPHMPHRKVRAVELVAVGAATLANMQDNMQQTEELQDEISTEVSELLHNEVNLMIFVLNKAVGFNNDARAAIDLVIDIYGTDALLRCTCALAITHCDNISRDTVIQKLASAEILKMYMRYFDSDQGKIFTLGNPDAEKNEIQNLRSLIDGAEKIEVLKKKFHLGTDRVRKSREKVSICTFVSVVSVILLIFIIVMAIYL